jgi:spermidine synthase
MQPPHVNHVTMPGLTPTLRRGLFLLFFVSGACGLLYQIVWLRLAFAVITPVLSVVVAIFMLGLALGSWGAGTWVETWSRTSGLSPIYLYAGA